MEELLRWLRLFFIALIVGGVITTIFVAVPQLLFGAFTGLAAFDRTVIYVVIVVTSFGFAMAIE